MGPRLQLIEFDQFVRFCLPRVSDLNAIPCANTIDSNTIEHLKSDSSSMCVNELSEFVPVLFSYLAVAQMWFYIGEISRQCKYSSVSPVLQRAARFERDREREKMICLNLF